METCLQDRFPIERQLAILSELSRAHELGFDADYFNEVRAKAKKAIHVNAHGVVLVVPRLTAHQHVPGFVRSFEMLTCLITDQAWHKPLRRTDIFNGSVTERLISNDMSDTSAVDTNELVLETLDINYRCYESPGGDSLKAAGPSTAVLMLLAYATAWPFETFGVWLNGYRLRSVDKSIWHTPAFVRSGTEHLFLRAYSPQEEPTLDDEPDRKHDTVKPWILPTYINPPVRIQRTNP